jgi:hypothetical protein
VQSPIQELCGAVSKREEEVPGMAQYRDRISAIVGNLVRAPELLRPGAVTLGRSKRAPGSCHLTCLSLS